MSELTTVRDTLFDALCEPRRRYALSVLRTRTRPITTEDLATAVAALEREKPLVRVTEAEHADVLTALHHSHLPKLAAAGLVTVDGDRNTVSTADRTTLGTPAFDSITGDEAVADPSLDACLAVLATPRRRIVLAALEAERRSLAVADLADRVIEWEREFGLANSGNASSASQGDVDRVLVTLHHKHLPKLAAADLVTYDAEAGTVAYADHPALDEAWLPSPPVDAAVEPTSATATPVDGSVRTIEGRDAVVARGRELMDQAEDELFLMVTTDGLLDDECLTRLGQAADRGVDVYVGSQTSAVRDAVRERIPEAVIWEPQRDWLTLPPTQSHVGRLLFADRNAIMLATLGEKDADGVRAETAITGQESENGLVVLMRQMLGPRLDTLDHRSEDPLSHLPL